MFIDIKLNVDIQLIWQTLDCLSFIFYLITDRNVNLLQFSIK